MKNRVKLLLAALLLPLAGLSQAGYQDHPEAAAWIKEMQGEGFSRSYLVDVLSKAKRKESILKALNRTAEGTMTWGRYSKIFIETKRIQNGNKFWKRYESALTRAEQQYGVPAQMIVSIIGVETRYGKVMGNYRVLDALATIGFDYPRRGKFFRNELKEFLLLAREEGMDVTKPKGSYAGAMGYGQFIPSSFRAYAVDFDGDGKRDIWNNPVDAIGSVANYFSRHGWKSNQPVISAASFNQLPSDDWVNNGLKPKLNLAQWAERGVNNSDALPAADKATLMRMRSETGDEYWFGLHNFYVITRYNHSRLYAMAVYQLSKLIFNETRLS